MKLPWCFRHFYYEEDERKNYKDLNYYYMDELSPLEFLVCFVKNYIITNFNIIIIIMQLLNKQSKKFSISLIKP